MGVLSKELIFILPLSNASAVTNMIINRAVIINMSSNIACKVI